jgi:signal transduction histidine kinase
LAPIEIERVGLASRRGHAGSRGRCVGGGGKSRDGRLAIAVWLKGREPTAVSPLESRAHGRGGAMAGYGEFRHFGGGRKGLFLVLRYVFITVAAYLVIFQNPRGEIGALQGLMIVAALASNVVLSAIPARSLFAWYVEAPVLIADTLWVSWAIHSTGAMGQEFFLLYFFVLFIAATSNNLPIVIFGAAFISLADIYLSSDQTILTTARLMRLVFFFTVALFYGQVLNEITRERQRADRGFAWARELEGRVVKRTAALQRLYVDLVIGSRVRAERIAGVAQELRGRLLRIVEEAKGPVDGQHRIDGERERTLAAIGAAAGDLLHVVNSLASMTSGADAAAGADCAPAASEPLRLDHFLAELQRRSWPVPNAEVELLWAIGRDLPVVDTDPVRLRLVLEHLVGNALKFTSKGSVTVGVRNLVARQAVEFRVDDTGAGIDDRELPRLFQPFQRVEESGGTLRGRISTGLAVVESLIEQLGGELTVRSTVGRGSSFVVRLPHRSGAASAACAVTGPEAEGSIATERGRSERDAPAAAV